MPCRAVPSAVLAALSRLRALAGVSPLALVPLAVTLLLAAGTGLAAAAPEKCPRMVAGPKPVRLAALAPVAPGSARRDVSALRLAQGPDGKAGGGAGEVRLTFLGHASFLIESPAGVTIVTDYNDYVRAPLVPRVATMNHAHDTHFTEAADPGIEFVLRGWNPQGGAAHHELTLDDVWVRNVPTNTRNGSGTEYDGNSMFVFEVAGLCIAHLGHLHHLLTPDHLEALGRIDVVLAPVDGSYTLDIEGMVETLKAINPPLVIPMHYFSAWGLDRFLSRLGKDWQVERSGTPTVMLSRPTLPKERTLLVLPGR
ncbi:MBL fold metallo-hydrolase [Xanthobacter dioxanivorans]|nr:MBL fold metallo-hydrolase [Xanthobacter dioxanivorans]